MKRPTTSPERKARAALETVEMLRAEVARLNQELELKPYAVIEAEVMAEIDRLRSENAALRKSAKKPDGREGSGISTPADDSSPSPADEDEALSEADAIKATAWNRLVKERTERESEIALLERSEDAYRIALNKLQADNERLEGALRIFAHAYETDNRPALWVIELGNELLTKWRKRNRDE